MGGIVGGLFGGGGGGGGGGDTFSSSLTTATPAFRLSGSSSFSFGRGSGGTSSTLERLGSVPQQQFGIRFPRILSDIDALRGTVAPGFSVIRSARQKAVSDARERAISTLSDNLSRRRLQGSTFAESAMNRTEREFADLEAEQMAQSFLEELDANQRIIAFEGMNVMDAMNFELAELGVAAGFANTVSDMASRNAQFAANLAARESESSGSFLGNLIGLGASIFTGGAAAPAFAAPAAISPQFAWTAFA